MMFDEDQKNKRSQLQAHMYLSGSEIDEWLTFMLEKAGPFKNNGRFTSINIRENMAIVVTVETGQNKFRQWKDEQTAWFVAAQNGKWKVITYFIKK